jgi:G-protein signaling modulator 2
MDAENNDRNMRQNQTTGSSGAGATVPDEDFFSLIQRLQGGRMEDQRAAIPRPKPAQPPNSSNLNQLNNSAGNKKKDGGK